MSRKLILGSIAGVLALAILACGQVSPTPAPTVKPTAVPQPTAKPTEKPTEEVSPTAVPTKTSETGGANATLTVINDTNTEIWYVYISPSDSDDWGDDWLGDDVIAPGESYTFELAEGTYDLRADDKDHNEMASRYGEYISGDMEWRLYTEGEEGGGGEGGTASLTLVNNSGKKVCYVYISPNTNDSWGDDWLGEEEIIRPGESRTFYLEPGFYDLRADDCDGEPIAEEYDEEISGDVTWTLER